MPREIDERALTPRGAVLPEELTGERTGGATRGADDGPGLGRAVAAAYARAVRFQREQPGRTPEQALTESREPPAWEPAELADAPAGSVSCWGWAG